MPFAWTAIHLIDIINGVSHADLGTAPSTEKDSGVSSGSQRKVRKPLYITLYVFIQFKNLSHIRSLTDLRSHDVIIIALYSYRTVLQNRLQRRRI